MGTAVRVFFWPIVCEQGGPRTGTWRSTRSSWRRRQEFAIEGAAVRHPQPSGSTKTLKQRCIPNALPRSLSVPLLMPLSMCHSILHTACVTPSRTQHMSLHPDKASQLSFCPFGALDVNSLSPCTICSKMALLSENHNTLTFASCSCFIFKWNETIVTFISFSDAHYARFYHPAHLKV